MAKKKASAGSTVRTIRRQTRKKYSAEDKIRIVIEGLRGESTIAELCRKEGISQSIYYSWSKEFLEAGKSRLAGDITPNYYLLDEKTVARYSQRNAGARIILIVRNSVDRVWSYAKMTISDLYNRPLESLSVEEWILYLEKLYSWWKEYPE